MLQQRSKLTTWLSRMTQISTQRACVGRQCCSLVHWLSRGTYKHTCIHHAYLCTQFSLCMCACDVFTPAVVLQCLLWEGLSTGMLGRLSRAQVEVLQPQVQVRQQDKCFLFLGSWIDKIACGCDSDSDCVCDRSWGHNSLLPLCASYTSSSLGTTAHKSRKLRHSAW